MLRRAPKRIVLFSFWRWAKTVTGGNNSFTFLHDLRKLAEGSSNKPFRFGLLIALSSLHGCPRP